MTGILKEIIEGEQFELLIDTNIFPKDIILKAAYTFLDKGYFFFRFDADNNIVLEFQTKKDVKIEAKSLIGEFSDELLAVYLRDKLEKDNKVIREVIVQKALL
jgi:His-Xaa-Ser system protein HxsD